MNKVYIISETTVLDRNEYTNIISAWSTHAKACQAMDEYEKRAEELGDYNVSYYTTIMEVK